MTQSWQANLERWQSAGLLDATALERIQAYETSHQRPSQLRWPVLIAVAFGALMLGAGVLLFVSAHWDDLSPTGRFSLVLLMVAVFHVAGALAHGRFPALATALHGIGTIAAGAGIFLSAQNLQPAGKLAGRNHAVGDRRWDRVVDIARLGPGISGRDSHSGLAGFGMDRRGQSKPGQRPTCSSGIIAGGTDLFERFVCAGAKYGSPSSRVDPPRPIRLATKKNGVLRPLSLN